MNETRNTNNVAQRRRTKQRHTKTTKSRKKKLNIDVKITYCNKREIEKRVKGVILGQILTLKSPSLVDEGEDTKILMTTILIINLYMCVYLYEFF